MTERRVTSRDVAQKAGVSQSTVSYVMNDAPGQTISAATRERVLQAAAELGYTPSATARALRRGTSEVVLVVIPDGQIGQVALEVLGAFGEIVDGHGYSVVYQRRRGRALDAILRELRPVGVADVAAFTPEDEAAAAHLGIPVVGLSVDGVDGQAMRIPQGKVGALQVGHLVARGHTHLGYAASADPLATILMRPRLAGVQAACAEHGLPAPVVVDVPLFPDAAARAVRRLRDRDDPVTAVCAYDDEVALAVVAGAHAVGVRVPDDLAVVGVDDLPLARLALPPITSVGIRTTEVGSGLARHLLRRLRPDLGLPEPDDEPPMDMVVRAST
jgi:DNA-binding LacI/PurR family transcriptional regulator